ncbi:MAG: hypothetical protein JST88_09315 [Bacteroidetes bacterium]|nr:hypothetical protein [Bacteroidota bacterium]
MKHLIYISLILAFASCRTVKHTATTDERKDSVQLAAGNLRLSERTLRDTVVIVKERKVQDTVSSWKLAADKPLYQEKTDKGLKAWLQKDSAGNISYGCNSDSFQIVVQNLVRERDSFTSLYKSEHFKNVVFHQDEKTVKERWTLGGWLMNNVYWLAPIALFVFWLVKKYFKWI